jgi:hypothetical protein
MIQAFVDRYMAHRAELAAHFAQHHPKDYLAIVRAVVTIIGRPRTYGEPDPARITEINHGEGADVIYLIAEGDYGPATFWWCRVHYGSCSGCDTLAAIHAAAEARENYRDIDFLTPTQEDVGAYMTLALHIVQALKVLGGDTVY